jgi:hypothetical protein
MAGASLTVPRAIAAYPGRFGMASNSHSLSPPERSPTLLGLITRIPSWNALRPLAGVAVDTCLIHRADPSRHIHPKRGPIPAGTGVPAFVFIERRTP